MNFHIEAIELAKILFGDKSSDTKIDVIQEALRSAYRIGAMAAARQTMRLLTEPELTYRDALEGLGL